VTQVRRRQSATDPRVFNLDHTLYMNHPLYFFVTVAQSVFVVFWFVL
jgi:hypothetical protein